MGNRKGEPPDPFEELQMELSKGVGGRRIPSRSDWYDYPRYYLGPRRPIKEHPTWFVLLSMTVFFAIFFGAMLVFTWGKPDFPGLVVASLSVFAIIFVAVLAILKSK